MTATPEYVAGLKAELANELAAGREDRAAQVVAELKRCGEKVTERAVSKPATERTAKK